MLEGPLKEPSPPGPQIPSYATANPPVTLYQLLPKVL